MNIRFIRATILAATLGLAFAAHDSNAKGTGPGHGGASGCCSGNSGTGKGGMPGVTSNGAMGFGATHGHGKGGPTPSPSPAPSVAAGSVSPTGPTGHAPNGAGDSCQVVMAPWPGIPGLYHYKCQ